MKRFKDLSRPEQWANLLKRNQATAAEIAQIFRDVAFWNETHPAEDLIDPDPDNELKKALAHIDQQRAQLLANPPTE